MSRTGGEDPIGPGSGSNKESHCLCLEPASLLAPRLITEPLIIWGQNPSGLSQSCLGHKEEGKIFSPDQLETTKEGKGHPETPSQGNRPPWQVHRQQSAALASRLQERKGRWLPLLSALVPRGLALGFSPVS